MLQAASDEYEVLCLTRKDVRLLHGNRDNLQEVPLKNVPKTIWDDCHDHDNGSFSCRLCAPKRPPRDA